MGTDNYSTEPMIVGKGALQGDCLCPLLFNMIVNTLIKSIDHEKICCMAYSSAETLLPHHWFQFPDDSAIITSTEKYHQLLLNVFHKWCNWAGIVCTSPPLPPLLSAGGVEPPTKF